MKGYAIYELTPAPWGDDYRFICIRDNKEDAQKILDILYMTDYNFSFYEIVPYNIGDKNDFTLQVVQ